MRSLLFFTFLLSQNLFCCAADHYLPSPPLTGFVLHFDHFSSSAEIPNLVEKAYRAGAHVINIVPPAHIWESRADLTALDLIIHEIERRDLSFVITRIDACHLPDAQGNRESFLFKNILNKPGILPSGKPSSDYFWTTVNRKGYRSWMEEETRFYAQRVGHNRHLRGINVGAFSEPFVSQRSGFLEFDEKSNFYELTQYTPEAQQWWQSWLKQKFKRIETINRIYKTTFSKITDIPMPLNELDSRFGNSPMAYFDFANSLGDWYFESYERCRKIWHDETERTDVPFILQMSGYDAEKFILGRPDLWALQWMNWLQKADAVGLSLYTNSGYADLGHRSIGSMIDVLRSFSVDKPCFILESGTELPFPVLNASEFQFLADQARQLQLKTFIYEFFKKPFLSDIENNDGHLLTEKGIFRKDVFKATQRMFSTVQHTKPPMAFQMTILMDADAVRTNTRIGEIYKTLLDASADIPFLWITTAQEIRRDLPLWAPTSLHLQQPSLIQNMINTAPNKESSEYAVWLKMLKEALNSQP